MIPDAAVKNRRMAAVAFRQRIALCVTERRFQEALKLCTELRELLILGPAGAAAARKAAAKHGGDDGDDDGTTNLKPLYTHDPNLSELLLVATLLEGDVRWRMADWEPCYKTYNKILDASVSHGKSKKGGGRAGRLNVRRPGSSALALLSDNTLVTHASDVSA